MSDIENRLRASMRFGVLDGSAEERGILEVQIEEAIRELVCLRARAEAAERERDAALQLAYIGEHRFPDLTWKARCEETVSDLRASQSQVERLTEERDRLRAALEKAKGPIAIAASYADAPEVSVGLRVHARDCARILPEINAALREEAPDGSSA